MTVTPNSNTDFEIRLATDNDRHHLVALEDILQSRPEPDFIDLLFNAVDAGERSVLLSFSAGRPAGYVILNWNPVYSLFARLGIPEIQDLNVLPDDRRHGLGALLVAGCEDLARARGMENIGLAVGLGQSYGSAQRLYARLGYLPDGLGISYDRELVRPGQRYPVDDNLCLAMVKDLTV